MVNNNAAAVLLALSSIAAGREVLIAAGELVEIGDSFRIPQILAFSGAVMKTVGCTNSTRIQDYRDAITGNTAVLLKVHPSNYRIEGFVKSTAREELAALASERGLVFMEDLGSGLLSPLAVPDAMAKREHSVRDCLEAGAHIVTFSGDKLLGGPQIGGIAGAKALVDKMKKHQLSRALRVDKMTLAAFGATLQLYLDGRRSSIPLLNMIEMDESTLQRRAQRLLSLLPPRAPHGWTISIVKTQDAIGGGSFPTDLLHGLGVGIRCAYWSARELATRLRAAPIPVIAVIHAETVVLHVRTLLEGDEARIEAAFTHVLCNELV